MRNSEEDFVGPISKEEVQISLADAAASGDDDQMFEAIVQLFQLRECQEPIKTWLNRLPDALHGDVLMLLATTIKLNAAEVAAAEDLEAEMRIMHFITALCSPDPRVLGALKRGAS